MGLQLQEERLAGGKKVRVSASSRKPAEEVAVAGLEPGGAGERGAGAASGETPLEGPLRTADRLYGSKEDRTSCSNGESSSGASEAGSRAARCNRSSNFSAERPRVEASRGGDAQTKRIKRSSLSCIAACEAEIAEPRQAEAGGRTG